MGGLVHRTVLAVAVTALVIAASAACSHAQSFLNFESGHVRPLALSPDGAFLFAVNTPDNRLTIFAAIGVRSHPGGRGRRRARAGRRRQRASTRRAIPRPGWSTICRTASASSTIDDADISLSRVTHTLLVGDEPRDIVIRLHRAGRPRLRHHGAARAEPAASTCRASPRKASAAPWCGHSTPKRQARAPGGTPLSVIELFGDTPRALAVEPRRIDGLRRGLPLGQPHDEHPAAGGERQRRSPSATAGFAPRRCRNRTDREVQSRQQPLGGRDQPQLDRPGTVHAAGPRRLHHQRQRRSAGAGRRPNSSPASARSSSTWRCAPTTATSSSPTPTRATRSASSR